MLKTVNIIECVGGQIQQLKSFPDDKKGNLAAENLFMKLCQENQPEDRSSWMGIDYYLEEGYYSNRDYFLYLVYSQAAANKKSKNLGFPILDFNELVGKTIASVEKLKLKKFDDTGFLRLCFSDGAHCVVGGGYKGYTGNSEDEYPTVIFLADNLREKELEAII